MEFSDKLKDFTKRIDLLKDGIKTEEATKTSLVMPFFNLLGYDVFNPMEFCPEYTADVGIKKGEKIDYAILIDNTPQILIECKSCTDSLSKYTSQLFRYFGTSKAKFGILTNGIVYKFYTDLEETNKMDLTPFLEVDLSQLRDAQINELKKFSKDNFDTDKIFSTASELKYSNLIKNYLSKELESPSEDFTKHILTYVYEGQRTQKVIEKYQPLVKKAFNSFINDIVNQKITAALTPDDDHVATDTNNTEVVANSVPDEPTKVSKIVTTEEELQAFYIVRAIAAEITDIKNIAHRDTESYFGILFGDNNRKPICRVNFDTKQKQLLLPDESKKFTRHYIDNVDDIYKFKDELLKIIKIYL
ncbi:type I restriction endonuclease [Coprococcus aceti]|uniref:type I restriction endonuclease n=1 Tax=Coprococcus aceti TaxID=2981786 RepID=UPI0022DFC570|nr:type I restriction endonuclease [Coprococcus aceti]